MAAKLSAVEKNSTEVKLNLKNISSVPFFKSAIVNTLSLKNCFLVSSDVLLYISDKKVKFATSVKYTNSLYHNIVIAPLNEPRGFMRIERASKSKLLYPK